MDDKNYTLLHEVNNKHLEKLIALYNEDRYKARIIFFNSGGNTNHNYKTYRLVLFEKPNGDYNVSLFRRGWGISVTNRMYSREAKLFTFICKDGNFSCISNGRFKAATINVFNDLDEQFRNAFFDKVLKVKYGWFRNLIEADVMRRVSLNTIVKKKLFSGRKILCYHYGFPYPVSKMLHKSYRSSNYNRNEFVGKLKYHKPYMLNVENLNEDWLKASGLHLFHDSLRMAKILDRKVNCSWSAKRLKEEHDKWSNEITEVVSVVDNRELIVAEVYKDFASFSGYRLLTTTRELALEGKRNKHCVATYSGGIDSGRIGIYSISGYTLELRYNKFKKELQFVQFRGLRNTDAPNELKDVVLGYTSKFNKLLSMSTVDKYINTQTKANETSVELPF